MGDNELVMSQLVEIVWFRIYSQFSRSTLTREGVPGLVFRGGGQFENVLKMSVYFSRILNVGASLSHSTGGRWRNYFNWVKFHER